MEGGALGVQILVLGHVLSAAVSPHWLRARKNWRDAKTAPFIHLPKDNQAKADSTMGKRFIYLKKALTDSLTVCILVLLTHI